MTITQIAEAVAEKESARRSGTEHRRWGPRSVFDYKPPHLDEAGIYSGLLEPRWPCAAGRPPSARPGRRGGVRRALRGLARDLRRMLDITDDGLLNPLWRAAGA